jgi:hypothetical protein
MAKNQTRNRSCSRGFFPGPTKIADCQLPIADLKSTNLTIWQSAIRNTMKVLGEIHHEN